MHCHSGAVQILLADHWGGDREMVRCSWGPPRTDSHRKGDQQGGQWAGFQEYLMLDGQGLASQERGGVDLKPLYPGTSPSLRGPQGSEATA